MVSLSDKFYDLHYLGLENNAWLSVLKREDITDGYLNGINDPEVRKFLGHENPLSIAELQEFVVRHEQSERQVLLGFFLDGQHRGNVRIHDVVGKVAWLGISVFDRSIWGQGWATKILVGAIQLVWSQSSLDVVYAGVDRENVGSSRAFKKAGFSVSRETPSGTIFAARRPLNKFD